MRFLSPDEKIQNYSTLEFIKDAYAQIGPYRRRFWIGSFYRLVGDLINLYPAYALAEMINIVSRGNFAQNSGQIWTLLIIWVIVAQARQVLIYRAKITLFNISDKVSMNIEQRAINHLFLLDIAWHEKENTGNKLKRIHTAAQGFNRLLHIWANNILEIVVNFIGMTAILYHFNKDIAVFMVIFLVVYYILTRAMFKKVAQASHEVNIADEEITGLEFESLNNIRTVKIMSMIKTLGNRLSHYADKWYEKTQRKVFWLQTRGNGSASIGLIFKAAMLCFILYGILHGRFEVGLLVLYNAYFGRFWDSIDELSNVTEDILVSRYAAYRLKGMMNEKVMIDSEVAKISFPKNWKNIELKNVSFAYGDNQVLKDISFKIERGQRIGIIGLSGAGKSTLFKLLLKEYESFEGEILIDGVPIQQLSKEEYFKHVAVVLQETEVFNFSLRENIYLAGPDITNKEQELQKALTTAHITDFLEKLPQGIDTEIGEKGVRLSGGEKQRLGIGRAVFKNPQLLLMDEATSHLDLESEEKIQDSLHQFFNNVTAVVIAHRLTTIKEMDKILVIENGEIIESGNFSYLHNKKGRFHELWEKQRL